MSVEVTRLPSGLAVVTDEMPHLQTASIGIWIGSGSRDEQPNEHGIAHLLEHMAFKGTKRRDARQIAEEIESVGGYLNAATSVETTNYFARVLKDDTSLALDVLSDILSNPTFVADELEREKNVILQEIGASEDSPDDQVFEYLQATAFPNQAVGRAILGTHDSVTSFSGDNLRGYLKRNYRGPDMLVVATGAVKHANIVADAERLVGHFNGPSAPVPEAAQFSGGSKIEGRELEQVHIAFALEGVPYRNPNYHSLQVFTNVLGGGMSSRLFQEAREKRGLCYAIQAFHSPYSDTGLFGLYSGTDAADLEELMQLVVDEIANTAETLTEEEVARSKAGMKAALLMALESSGARAEQLAFQMFAYGRPLSIEEIVTKVDAVTVQSARAAGRTLIGRNRPAVAALGPGGGLESAVTILDSLVRPATNGSDAPR
jgi:predicted Zn-dependent peptidase